jgi:hypothetical protein
VHLREFLNQNTRVTSLFFRVRALLLYWLLAELTNVIVTSVRPRDCHNQRVCGSVECTSWQNNNTNSEIYSSELSASYSRTARARKSTCREYGEIKLLLLLLLGFFISSIQCSTIQTYSHMRPCYSLASANIFQCVLYVIILLMFCHLNCHWLLSRHV